MHHLLPLSILVLCLCSAVLTGCRSEPGKETLRSSERLSVAYGTYGGSAPIIIAHEQGFFRAQGLTVDLHPFTSGNLALEEVLAGRADIATATETAVVPAIMNNSKLSILATICEVNRPILIIARKDRGIRSAQDLRGKTIGVPQGTAADFFLHIFLTVAYIDPREVSIVPLAVDQIVPALLEGRVTAVSIWAPHTLILEDALGANATVLSDDSLYTLTWNLIANQEFFDRHPEPALRFLRALAQANQFIATHSASETRALVTPFAHTEPAILDRIWPDFRFTMHLDQSLILNLEDQARWMAQKEGRAHQPPPNFLHCIDTRPLQAIDGDAVRIPGR